MLGSELQLLGPSLFRNSATDLQAQSEMLRTANSTAKEPGRILVLLLVFVFLSASLTCAAMASIPVASAHPCCPHSDKPDPDHCTKMGCISTVPVLPPESLTSTIEFPVVDLMDCDSVADDSLPEWDAVPALRPAEFELFLRHHQFLI